MDNPTSFDNISVFSLNVWGLPYFLGTDKCIRLSALGEYLKSENFDIVCLQELWSQDDYNLLKTVCNSKLPYAHYFISGVLGSGLCILSKWPILKTFFTQWSVNGYCHMLHHGDWFGGKGVALAQIKIKNYLVNVYNTHLIANYDSNDHYITHRVIQAFDTGLFIDLTSANTDFSILCGDLNSSPTDICTKLIKAICQFRDSIDATNCHGFELLGTNGGCTNSYSSIKDINSKSSGCRIDYILYKCGINNRIRATDYKLPLLTKIPGLNKSYSDHEAVAANFSIFKKSSSDDEEENLQQNVQLEDLNPYLLTEAIVVCSSGEEIVMNNCGVYFCLSFLLLTILLFTNQFLLSLISYTIFLIIVYLVFMSTIWHRLEINAIISAKKRIEVLLESNSTKIDKSDTEL